MAPSTVFMNNNSSKNVAVFSGKCRKISKEFKAYFFFVKSVTTMLYH